MMIIATKNGFLVAAEPIRKRPGTGYSLVTKDASRVNKQDNNKRAAHMGTPATGPVILDASNSMPKRKNMQIRDYAAKLFDATW